jgi:hypothetical protein
MRSAQLVVGPEVVEVAVEDGEAFAAPLTARRAVALQRLWPDHPSAFTVSGLDTDAAVAVCVGDWAKVDQLIEGDFQAATDRTPDLWDDLDTRRGVAAVAS